MTPQTPSPLLTSANSDRGFTIIEVVVMAFVVLITIGALAAVFTRTTTTQSKSKILSNQKSVVDAVIERASSDMSWIDAYGCDDWKNADTRHRANVWNPPIPTDASQPPVTTNSTAECLSASQWFVTQYITPPFVQAQDSTGKLLWDGGRPVPKKVGGKTVPNPDSPLHESNTKIKHNVRFKAIMVDLASDGIGAHDKDGIVPDTIRIEASDTVTADGIRISTATGKNAFRSTAEESNSINMTVRATTGSIKLRACAITNQIDERIAVGMCNKGNTSGDDGVDDSIGIDKNIKCADDDPDTSVDDVTCDPYRYVSSTGLDIDRHLLRLRMLGSTQFTLYGPLGQKDAMDRPLPPTDADGIATMSRIPPGRYQLKLPSTPEFSGENPKYTLWNSRSVPAGGEVVIEGGKQAESVQILRPRVTRPMYIKYRTRDTTDPANPKWYDHTFTQQAVKLVPVPEGRQALAQGGDNDGWTIFTPPGATYSDWKASEENVKREVFNPEPGLYAVDLIHFPGTRFESFDSYTDPDGGDADASPDAKHKYLWIGVNYPTVGPEDKGTFYTAAGMVKTAADPDGDTLTLSTKYCNPAVRGALVDQFCGTILDNCTVGGVTYAPCEQTGGGGDTVIGVGGA